MAFADFQLKRIADTGDPFLNIAPQRVRGEKIGYLKLDEDIKLLYVGYLSISLVDKIG